MISNLLILLVRFYQKCISPVFYSFGVRCRFSPSCSNYMIQAIQTHGPIKGVILGVYRILRCNPFGRCGFDPVPKKGRWKN